MGEAQNDDAKKLDERLAALYQDIIANIKVTDDISFKLLGTVPLLSGVGSGALSLLLKSGHPLNDFAVLALSLVGCAITFGLYQWELRNIQRCAWFISRAARIERRLLPNYKACQFYGFDNNQHINAKRLKDIKVKPFWRLSWGKTQAEKLIYNAAIAAWLIPAIVSLASLITNKPSSH